MLPISFVTALSFCQTHANESLLSINSLWHWWSYQSSGSARDRISSVNVSTLRQKSYFIFFCFNSLLQCTSVLGYAVWQPQVVGQGWVIAGTGSCPWTSSTKPSRGSVLYPLAPVCPRESRVPGSAAALLPFHPHGLAPAALVASAGQHRLEWFGAITARLAGARDRGEQEMILTVCRIGALLFPKKCLAIWNIKMLTFLHDEGICFWKFLCFPKHSTSFCTTVDFPPPHTLPLGKRLWIQGQCFNLTCIISYFHLVLGGPWWL